MTEFMLYLAVPCYKSSGPNQIYCRVTKCSVISRKISTLSQNVTISIPNLILQSNFPYNVSNLMIFMGVPQCPKLGKCLTGHSKISNRSFINSNRSFPRLAGHDYTVIHTTGVSLYDTEIEQFLNLLVCYWE